VLTLQCFTILSSSSEEIILAQEQSVVAKFDSRTEAQGTLVLTSSRLVFVPANREETMVTARVRFADVEDLNALLTSRGVVSIGLGSLDFEKGVGGGIFRSPALKIVWEDSGGTRKAEVRQDLYGGSKKKNLNDWVKVIELLKKGAVTLQRPSVPAPSIDTLEGKILSILGDMQPKGSLQIEQEVETAFVIEVDPDEVESAYKKLSSQGFVDVIPDRTGDNFYKKRSPLGEYDLSI